jgi:hypothetical protein
MSSDLTFLTNELGNTLRDRFSDILKENTSFFDCLVGYFFISGFYKIYPALENTGSDNFTQSGLQDNLEFNVELKNRADYDFAIAKFNELYLKFLYEYFKDELNRPDELEDIYIPDGFKRLKYQKASPA